MPLIDGLELEYDVQIPEFVAELGRLQYQQVPFAVSRAMNAAGEKARERSIRNIFQRFDVAQASRHKTSVVLSKGTKQRPDTTLRLRDAWLVQHVEGDTRKPGDVYDSLVIPKGREQKQIRRLKGRNTPAYHLRRKGPLKAFTRWLGHQRLGIYRHDPNDSQADPELLFVLERRVKLEPRFPFERIVVRRYAADFVESFNFELRRAIATARR